MPSLSEILGRTYRGYTGSRGDTGDAGPQGVQGIQGIRGDRGYTGSAGSQGVQGLDGAFAAQGVPGAPGPTGYTGSAGIAVPLAPQSNFILSLKNFVTPPDKQQNAAVNGAVHDSKGNVYLYGHSFKTDNTTAYSTFSFISKVDPSGNVIWTQYYTSRVADDPYFETKPKFIVMDASDNPIVLFSYITDPYEYFTETAKLNASDGSIVWKRRISTASQSEAYESDVLVDKQNNIYTMVYLPNTESGYSPVVIKYDNAGTLLWSKILQSTVLSVENGNIGKAEIDSENNLILYLRENITNSPTIANTVMKLDSGGTIIWQKSISKTAQPGEPFPNTDTAWYTTGMAIDSTDSIYVGGLYTNTIQLGFNYALLTFTKFNSAGVLQWQKDLTIEPMDYLTRQFDMVVDAQDNIYSYGDNYLNSSDRSITITKFSPSGNIIWSRKFYELAEPYGVEVPPQMIASPVSVFNGKVSFTVASTFNDENFGSVIYPLLVQLPSDGTSTGRYRNYYWLDQTATFTPSTYLLTDGELEIANTVVSDVVGDLDIAGFEIVPFTPELITIDSGSVIPNTIVTSITSANTLNWNSDIYDYYTITALAEDITISADTGSPITGKKVIFRIKDNGTPRAITWTTAVEKGFRAMGVTLPTTTTANKSMYIEALYDEIDKRWDVVNVLQEA